MIFFVALLHFCFTISNALTRIFAAIASVLVTTLVGCCIWTAWESTEGNGVRHKSFVVFRRTRDALFERVKGMNPFHTHRVLHHDHISLNRQLNEA